MKHFDSISVSKNPLYLLIWLRGLVVKQVSQFEDLGGGLGKQPRSDLPSPSVTNSPQNLTTTHNHYSVNSTHWPLLTTQSCSSGHLKGCLSCLYHSFGSEVGMLLRSFSFKWEVGEQLFNKGENGNDDLIRAPRALGISKFPVLINKCGMRYNHSFDTQKDTLLKGGNYKVSR